MSDLQKGIKIAAIILAIVIIGWIISSATFVLSLIAGTSNKKLGNYVEVYQNIENVNIDLVATKIIIKEGTEFKLEAKNITNKFSATVSDDTLNIKEKNTSFSNKKNVKEIILYIPNEINNLEINSGAGTVDIDNIIVGDIKIHQGAGVVNIMNSHLKKVDIEGGVGETKITASRLNDIDIEAGVGSIYIEANITGNNKIECGVGKTNLILLGNEEEYQLEVEKGLGSITINNEKQTNNTTYGNGLNTLSVEGGIGDISINFAQEIR